MLRHLVRRRASRSSLRRSRSKNRRNRIIIVSIAGLPLLLAVHARPLAAQSAVRLATAKTNEALRMAVPDSGAEAIPSRTEQPSGIASATGETVSRPVSRSASAAESAAADPEPAFEMGSLATTVGQIGFIPIGIQPAETSVVAESRSMQPTFCQVRVLAALNRRFPVAKFTAANILPASGPYPKFSVANVNIHGSPTQLATVNKGRYLPHRRMFFGLLIGYGPSLHIVSHPSFLDPHALVFSPTAFTAHLDSAWADTPVGLFLHFFLDVLRPKARNPCP